jgi:hypothetical protein
VDRYVAALREVLAEQAVGVFVRAPLPGASGSAEVDGLVQATGRPHDSGAISPPWSQVSVRRSSPGISKEHLGESVVEVVRAVAGEEMTNRTERRGKGSFI